MKQGWEIKKLGDVCTDLLQGINTATDKTEFVNEGIPILQAKEIGVDKLELNNCKFITEAKYKIAAERYKPQLGDILYNNIGSSMGRSIEVVWNYPFTIAWNVMRIIPDRKKVTSKFLNYLLQSPIVFDRIIFKSKGVGMPFISKKDLIEIEAFYPPLPEQQRIVVILDEAFAAIAKAKDNAEQNLKNAKELFESYLQGVFENGNWVEKKLSDLSDTGAGGTPLKSHKDYYQGGNVPWLRSGEVDKKDIVECELFITEKGLKNSSARLFPKDTVLIAMYGATAGQVGILRFECSTNQAVCGILPNKNIIPEFLYYKFMAGKQALVDQAVGGAQPNISQIKIKNTLVPFISLKEQQTIVKKLDALSAETKKLEAISDQKINDLEELKKSVLQKAFAGQLIMNNEQKGIKHTS